jgi:hypothetical protein
MRTFGFVAIVAGIGHSVIARGFTWPPLFSFEALAVACGHMLLYAAYRQSQQIQQIEIVHGDAFVYTARGAYINEAMSGSLSNLCIRIHRVIMQRNRPILVWHGFAVCAWHNEELLMVLMLTRRRSTADKMMVNISRSTGVPLVDDGDLLMGEEAWIELF